MKRDRQDAGVRIAYEQAIAGIAHSLAAGACHWRKVHPLCSNNFMNAMQNTGESTMDSELPPLPAEQILIAAGKHWLERVTEGVTAALVISPGRAQSAKFLQDRCPGVAAQAWYLDLHAATVTAAFQEEAVEVLAGPDLPEHEYQLVLMPVLKRAEAELTRDLLQQSHERLGDSGWLVASVDNPKDTWLHDQLQALFDKVTCERNAKGCVYWARKTSPLKKPRSFECEISIRDGEQRVHALTRPGVFSHRRVDSGARQLLLSAEIGEEDNVLDMGCGSGIVALSCGFKTRGRVFGVDSNARAVACLQAGAKKNNLENVDAIWNADGALELPVAIDVALANPPYFGDEIIAQHFIETSLATLRTGGALLVVTKQPNWFEASFESVLEDVVTFEAGKYWVVCGRKPDITQLV